LVISILQVSGFIFYKHGGFEYYVEVAGAVNLFTNRNQVHLLNLLRGAKGWFPGWYHCWLPDNDAISSPVPAAYFLHPSHCFWKF